jgi:dipeptidase E
MRLLLVSNSGSPFLEHCRDEIAAFLGPIRRVGYITAARLGDEDVQFQKASRALAEVGLAVEHLKLGPDLAAGIARSDAVFSSGGNTYALLSRLRAAGVLDDLAMRVREGMPYVGTSAGTNIAGPNILATNDWNVVGATRFDAMKLVPWAINPHFLETDPAMAPGGETRDHRIAEYLRMNDCPVLGIEEGTAVRVEGAAATVSGRGRVKLFRRGAEPAWFKPGERLPEGMTHGD